MKPIHTFLFLILITLGFGCLIWALPSGGFTVWGQQISLPSFDDFHSYFTSSDSLNQEKQSAEKHLKEFIPLQIKNLESNTAPAPYLEEAPPKSLLDIKKKSMVFHIDTLKTKIQKIEFPNNDKTELLAFFKRARNSKKLIHILHYGDSQIEGDRISSFLRNQLQKEFGGYGIGLLSPKPLVKRFSIEQNISDNWLRFPIFGHKEGDMPHKKYGGLGVLCRYAPYTQSTSPDSLREILEAEISFEKSKVAYFKDRMMRNFNIYYTNPYSPVNIEIYTNDSLLFKGQLETDSSMSCFKYRFSKQPKAFKVKFKGHGSPDFYAMSLEADRGLVVDNIPMRGSSGTYFTQMNTPMLSAFYKKMDVGLVLLEFGGNVVPGLKNETGIKNYKYQFSKQVKLLKRLLPHTPIIILGVADMSKKVKNQYITYPLLEPLRNAMKELAFENKVGYWDMYEAMGGANSMPSWVNNKDKLAIKDYTHFTSKGAHLIGNMFINAFLYEYQLFCKAQENTK